MLNILKSEDKKDEYLDILSEVNIKEAENVQTTEELVGKTFDYNRKC